MDGLHEVVVQVLQKRACLLVIDLMGVGCSPVVFDVQAVFDDFEVLRSEGSTPRRVAIAHSPLHPAALIDQCQIA